MGQAPPYAVRLFRRFFFDAFDEVGGLRRGFGGFFVHRQDFGGECGGINVFNKGHAQFFFGFFDDFFGVFRPQLFLQHHGFASGFFDGLLLFRGEFVPVFSAHDEDVGNHGVAVVAVEF